MHNALHTMRSTANPAALPQACALPTASPMQRPHGRGGMEQRPAHQQPRLLRGNWTQCLPRMLPFMLDVRGGASLQIAPQDFIGKNGQKPEGKFGRSRLSASQCRTRIQVPRGAGFLWAGAKSRSGKAGPGRLGERSTPLRKVAPAAPAFVYFCVSCAVNSIRTPATPPPPSEWCPKLASQLPPT